MPGDPEELTAGPSPDDAATRSPTWAPRADLALVGFAALVVRLPALLASRHLTFDDGVYGASAVAMREGALPFRDVFSSQGPLHLPLVRLADLIGLEGSQAPRLLPITSGVIAALLAVLIGRRLGGRHAGLAAGLLLALSGSFVWVSGPVHSDPAAIALALGALLAALRHRVDPWPANAALVGLLMGAALAAKSVVLPVAVPVGLLLLATRRWGQAALAVTVAGAVGVLSALPFGLDRVIDQAFTYHTEAAEGREPLRNVRKIASTLADRDPALLVLGLVALGLVVLAWRRRTPGDTAASNPSADVLVLSWLAATLALLLYVHPLWRPHLSHLAPPLALLVALHRPPTRVLLATSAVLVPLQLADVRDVTWPGPYDPWDQQVVDVLAALPEGTLAISDEPGLVWRAGRRTPPDLVDTSQLRVDAGRITEDSLVAAAGEPNVCAVVVTSARFGEFEDLAARLVPLGYRAVELDSAQPGRHDVLYLRFSEQLEDGSDRCLEHISVAERGI